MVYIILILELVGSSSNDAVVLSEKSWVSAPCQFTFSVTVSSSQGWNLPFIWIHYSQKPHIITWALSALFSFSPVMKTYNCCCPFQLTWITYFHSAFIRSNRFSSCWKLAILAFFQCLKLSCVCPYQFLILVHLILPVFAPLSVSDIGPPHPCRVLISSRSMVPRSLWCWFHPSIGIILFRPSFCNVFECRVAWVVSQLQPHSLSWQVDEPFQMGSHFLLIFNVSPMASCRCSVPHHSFDK